MPKNRLLDLVHVQRTRARFEFLADNQETDPSLLTWPRHSACGVPWHFFIHKVRGYSVPAWPVAFAKNRPDKSSSIALRSLSLARGRASHMLQDQDKIAHDRLLLFIIKRNARNRTWLDELPKETWLHQKEKTPDVLEETIFAFAAKTYFWLHLAKSARKSDFRSADGRKSKPCRQSTNRINN